MSDALSHFFFVLLRLNQVGDNPGITGHAINKSCVFKKIQNEEHIFWKHTGVKLLFFSTNTHFPH